jgi:hypothetical protein
MNCVKKEKVKRYIVGIQYKSCDENKGFFDIQRKTTMIELAEEVLKYILYGKTSFPAFSPEANPEVLYAWDMDNWEDGDCYPELIKEINKHIIVR